MSSKQERLFQEYSVWKAIFSMAVPAMISMLVMILYNIADIFFVGRTGDMVQVAAVSVVGPVFTVLMAIGSMLGGGGCVLIAKTLGQKEENSVKLYSSLCCWGSLAFGALFAAIVLPLRTPLLRFLGTNKEMWEYARTYLTVLALGAPVMVFTTGFGGVLRAEGAIKEGMICNLTSTLVNIILDPLFILTFKLGVGGAAIATVAGNVVGAFLLVAYVLRGKTNFVLSPVPACRNPMALGKIVALGLPNAVSSVLVGIASAIANRLLVQYGTVPVAAMGAAGKATMVISMIQMGICMGVQPMLAYCYGERNLPRIRETLVKLSGLTIGIGLSVTLFCFFKGKEVVAMFLDHPEALALGQDMIRVLVLSGPFLGLYYIGSSFLQASGNAKLATLVSMLRQGIFLIPLLYLMNALLGITGNIAAHIVSDIAAAAVAVLLALAQYRKLQKGPAA